MELPFQPSPPEAPHFDQGRNAWILGHYVEVHAALREPALYQASAQNEMTGIDHAQLHAQVQADIARMTGVHESTISRKLDKLTATLKKRIKNQLVADGMNHAKVIEILKDIDIRDLNVDVAASLKQATF